MVSFLTYLQRLSLFVTGGRAAPTYVLLPNRGRLLKLNQQRLSLFVRGGRAAPTYNAVVQLIFPQNMYG